MNRFVSHLTKMHSFANCENKDRSYRAVNKKMGLKGSRNICQTLGYRHSIAHNKAAILFLNPWYVPYRKNETIIMT
jgi:hypothetical protein